MIDLNVISLIGIEGLRACSLAELDMRGMRNPVWRRHPAVVRCVPIKGSRQNYSEEKRTCKFHNFDFVKAIIAS